MKLTTAPLKNIINLKKKNQEQPRSQEGYSHTYKWPVLMHACEAANRGIYLFWIEFMNPRFAK